MASNTIKLSIAILLFTVAIILFFVLNAQEGIPDTEETKTVWFCSPCNQGFELSGPEMVEKISTGRLNARSDQEGPVRLRFVEVAECPHCKEKTGTAARRCPECNQIFAARTKEGGVAVCPKCQWNPVP